MAHKKIQLVLIDPQRSFCAIVPQEDQQKLHDGELCVPGAWDDMVRAGDMVRRLGKKLDDIHVTLDSHHLLHISHPIWLRNVDTGEQPEPFTVVREENGQIIGSQQDPSGNLQDVGTFTTKQPSFLRRTLDYLKALRDLGRYDHRIWPPHCLIGTKGHTIVEPLYDALHEWERDNFAAVNVVTKGSNYFTEHFSAVKAEVPDPEDASTGLNSAWIELLMEADEILLAGEARSHCLASTVRDTANEFAQTDEFIKKCVLLTDATSDVPLCEKLGEDFLTEMTKRGMRTTTTVDYLA